MNKFLIIAVYILIGSFLSNANSYKVFAINGSVSKSSDGSQLKRMDILKPAERLVFKPGSSLSLLDTDTRRVYKSSGNETSTSVAKIVLSAKKSAANSASVLSSSKTSSSTSRPLGAAFRGESEDSVINAIIASVTTDNIRRNIDTSVVGEKVTLPDGTFTFKIANNSARQIFVNVIRKTDTGWDVCLDLPSAASCISINPGVTMITEGFEFYDDVSDDCRPEYHVIVSSSPFDSQALRLKIGESDDIDKTREPKSFVTFSESF